MNFKELLKDNPWIMNILYSVLAILIAIILYMIITKLFFKKIDSKDYKLL